MGRDIRNYKVSQLSHKLTLRIYELTKRFPAEERFGLISQMRRSAYSIPMNLVEGGARKSECEFRQFVNIAKGSSAEIQYQLELVRDLAYITNDEYTELNNTYTEVGKMLTGLLVKLKANS